MNGSLEKKTDFDVVIIGAGISGINAAYRVQTQLPAGTTYTLLDSRNNIGGTWDFFKYPGLRSDSDLYTFGFPWRPWDGGKAIAEAPAILKYLHESIQDVGIDKNIRFNNKVQSMDWSSKTLKWTLNILADGKPAKFTAGFVMFGTGYYDYDRPLEVAIPGIEKFGGTVVHPQFWPENLDYSNKNVTVIGSGATAVTLLPSLAKTAKMTTMVQRSPSYVFSLPNEDDPLMKLVKLILPAKLAHQIVRIRWMVVGYTFFYFCRTFPNVARRLIRFLTKVQLPKNISVDPHFSPAYNPWEQRLCMAPDGDFYKTLRDGKANIVTGKIKTVTKTGLLMENGETVDSDIIITATGLKIRIAGGITVTVDGKPLHIPSKYMWKGVMLQDIPNAVFIIGYTNASWTLGADATAQLTMRLINDMHKKGVKAVVPSLPNPAAMTSAPLLNINSTYIQKALEVMPKVGNSGQWRPRTNYFDDIKEAKRGDIQSGLEYLR
jgi:cation diffusion facilitator CzcD-associated flavoprotein CzcO